MRSFRLEATRGEMIWAAVRIVFLAAPIAWSWQHDGPKAETVVWGVLIFFAEILVFGIVELIATSIRRPKCDAE